MIPVVITFPPELPVSQRREDIARAIRDNQVVIVAGATGSGKTTQLPKICLELGRTSIGHTQPRRLAARTIAERIAEELGQEVGQTVGYQVRFTDQVGPDTKIKLMTDGILLNEMHRDRMLRKYDTIIIDEAHERSLNIDFLLGYLRQLLPQRPDLKLIITSATIDPQSFAEHFAAADGTPAPIIEVSGRTYPVEIRYRPLVAEAMDDDELSDAAPAVDRDYIEGISAALDELDRESSGDVLVFLSGETEIRDAADALNGKFAAAGRGSPTEILPLYGRLSAADQHKVFQPSTVAGVRRRIVLATNVAETSLTVPGIRYVIDAGTARISRYSVRSKVQRLPIEAISQASANQRSGRSGRTSDGIAIRLYSEEDFTRRPEYTEPEILRTNLAAVILQMISLGLGDIAAFPFLTPPDSRGIKDGLDLLAELGAVAPDTAGRAGTKAVISKLTRIGQQLAKLPIDPRFGRMVVESKTQGMSREVMAIVAGLTIQDPRERPLERRAQADQQHARFADPTSDFLSLLNLWNYLETQQKELGSSAFRRLCKNEFLNYLRVREWQDVYKQLRQMAKPLGLHVGDPSVNPDGIHRSLLAGLLSHIGLKDTAKKDYIGARQQRFVIFPGSALAKKQRGGPGEGHPVWRAVGRRAQGGLRQDQPRGVTRPVHPARPGRGRVGPRPGRPASHRVRPRQQEAAHRAGRARGAHQTPRHPLRRRGRVRVLPETHPRGRLLHPHLRDLVAPGQGGNPQPAHHDRRGPRPRGRTGDRRGRLPAGLAPGRPAVQPELSVRTRRGGRRRDRADPVGPARAALSHRLRLAGARAPRRAGHRPDQVPAEEHPAQRRSGGRLGGAPAH